MAIEVPSIVISTTAPDHAQHLTTDLNDAFGRLARSTSAEIAAIASPIAGQVPGTTTNDDATVGNVGEYVESSISTGSAVALTSSIAANVTSISLTAGDWDVWVHAVLPLAGGASASVLVASISTTSATADIATPGRFGAVPCLSPGSAWATGTSCVAGPTRFSLSGTTTIYFVALAFFSGGTAGAYGLLAARRVR